MPRPVNGQTRRTFELLIAHPPTDECILWPHARTKAGYGKMTLPGGKAVNVHVRALEVTAGPRPSPGHDATHACRNRHCMNPAHLSWATRSQNSLDRHRDGTCAQAKLTPDQVREVRRLLNERKTPYRLLAERFGVSISTLEYIKARKIWAHIPD